MINYGEMLKGTHSRIKPELIDGYVVGSARMEQSRQLELKVLDLMNEYVPDSKDQQVIANNALYKPDIHKIQDKQDAAFWLSLANLGYVGGLVTGFVPLTIASLPFMAANTALFLPEQRRAGFQKRFYQHLPGMSEMKEGLDLLSNLEHGYMKPEQLLERQKELVARLLRLPEILKAHGVTEKTPAGKLAQQMAKLAQEQQKAAGKKAVPNGEVLLQRWWGAPVLKSVFPVTFGARSLYLEGAAASAAHYTGGALAFLGSNPLLTGAGLEGVGYGVANFGAYGTAYWLGRRGADRISGKIYQQQIQALTDSIGRMQAGGRLQQLSAALQQRGGRNEAALAS